MAHFSGAVLIGLVVSAAAIPVRYDQRQDGDWNVDAKLQNFFVVLAPAATNPANGGSSGINLLEFASKAVPLRLPIRPGSGLQAAAAAAAAAVGGVPVASPSNEQPQDRQGNPPALPEVPVAAPVARAALGYFAAPEAAVGAVPMLVAVPVPEVAPLPGAVFIPGPAVPVQSALTTNHIQPHGEPTALLPMLTVLKPGSNDKIPVQSVPAEILPTTLQQQPADKIASQSATGTPALITSFGAPAEAAPAQVPPAPAVAPAPAEAPALAQPEQEAVQEPVQALSQTGALRLIGTGIEDCGPSRVRNASGICEEARS